MTDWSGRDYAEVSSLQRTMVNEATALLEFAAHERVLDLGCGDGYLTRTIAGMVPGGFAVGADASPRMVATANAAGPPTASGPWFVVSDARALPFVPTFDAVVSFNALHWVPQQELALAQIAEVLRPGGRAVIQMVCAGERPSLESVAMTLGDSPRWHRWFAGFTAPFTHVDAGGYGELARSAGLALENVTVADRRWDFGSTDAFTRWCAVGMTAWTDRLSASDRDQFIADLVAAYELVAGESGLFRFTQMRAWLRRH